jgi:hypothetical protein
MDLDSLLELIDRALKSQDPSTRRRELPTESHERAGPTAYSAGYVDILEDINRLLGARRLGGSDGPWTEEDRAAERLRNEQYLQTKAKDLSSQYNVEKEKLDLRMKIEQACLSALCLLFISVIVTHSLINRRVNSKLCRGSYWRGASLSSNSRSACPPEPPGTHRTAAPVTLRGLLRAALHRRRWLISLQRRRGMWFPQRERVTLTQQREACSQA